MILEQVPSMTVGYGTMTAGTHRQLTTSVDSFHVLQLQVPRLGSESQQVNTNCSVLSRIDTPYGTDTVDQLYSCTAVVSPSN